MKHSQDGAGAAVSQSLLIISDQIGFARDIVARWQMEPHLPEFTVMSSDVWHRGCDSLFDVAIVGDVSTERTREVLKMLDHWAAPSLYISAPGESVHALRREFSRVISVPRHDAWSDTLVLLGGEMLRRAEGTARLRRLEGKSRSDEMHATLGRYMLEMRHNFNNALTSVLGNSELLLLDTAGLSESMREQLDTMHSMTLRLHEMMQRFSSLETEMYWEQSALSAQSSAKPGMLCEY
jgi:His Kinase A (phosphoacceptor) domain.